MEVKKRTKGFEDLEVYNNAYAAMLIVYKEIIPKLPREEEYDLKDQLSRSVKAIPRLIAEGHSKRHQNKGFQKYIYDALAESNETIVSLNQAKDLYARYINIDICAELINNYDKISRQLYNLGLSWQNFHNRNLKTQNDSRDATH